MLAWNGSRESRQLTNGRFKFIFALWSPVKNCEKNWSVFGLQASANFIILLDVGHIFSYWSASRHKHKVGWVVATQVTDTIEIGVVSLWHLHKLRPKLMHFHLHVGPCLYHLIIWYHLITPFLYMINIVLIFRNY